jgi:phospholipid/cholesterol/gamma-HCH transport system ATP-binding protein
MPSQAWSSTLETNVQNQTVAPVLRVAQLNAHYGKTQVLRDVDFSVNRAQICSILGTSGCGKSTLLKHMVGLLTPTSGSVTLLGQNVHGIKLSDHEHLVHRIGLLFQGGALIHSLSVRDNVALPLIACSRLPPPLAHDIAQLKLELVGMGHAAAMMPAQLSGGMKKRAALARAIATDPELLFCDEPGAGLDPVMAAELDALILGLRDRFGMTVVVVTHELSSIQTIADQVVMLSGGSVVANGPLEAVRALPHDAVQSFFNRARPAKAQRAHSLWDLLSTTQTDFARPR